MVKLSRLIALVSAGAKLGARRDATSVTYGSPAGLRTRGRLRGQIAVGDDFGAALPDFGDYVA
jgi:hypothetical protein